MLSNLGNHLLQSTLCVAVLWILTLVLKSNRAATRYWLWLTASLKFLVPFSLITTVGNKLSMQATSTTLLPRLPAAIRDASHTLAMPIISWPIVSGIRLYLPPESLGLSYIWIFGSALCLGFWVRAWLHIRSLRVAATPLSIDFPVPVMSTNARLEPGIFGILRPVLLLPEGITERLTARQLEAILAHELCHLRRRDNLTAAIHMLVETVFWFNPLLWWIRARLLDERERACDEDVLHAGREPGLYADSILTVCKFYLPPPVSGASTITGGDLKRRITRIMTGSIVLDLSIEKKWMLIGIGFAALVTPLVAGLLQERSASPPQAVAQREFEVVSVKPYTPKGMLSEGCTAHDDPVMISRIGCTLEELVEIAYDLKNYQVHVKAPPWVETERYVVQARSAKPARGTEMLQMLQGALAVRFHMTIHWEDRQGSVYWLERTGHELRLQLASETKQCGRVDVREGTLKADCLSIDDFAEALQEFVVKDRPVLNRTDISKEQRYRFNLEFSPSDDAGLVPSIYSALPNQLGLVLKAARGSIHTLVIDRAQRPQAN